MNSQQKSAAVKRYDSIKKQGATKEELADLLKKDPKKYSAKDQAAILAEVLKDNTEAGSNNGNGNPPPPPPPPPAAEKKKKTADRAPSPNDDLDLSGFDYSKLTGKKFKEYVELVGDRSFEFFDAEEGKVHKIQGQLEEQKSYDFECYRAQPVFKERFPGMKDSPFDFIGITLKNTTPEHTTRTSVKNVHELNSQILNQHSRAGHGRYYLLKK